MSSVFIQEFKKISKDISSTELSSETIQRIISAYDRVLYYSNVIRTEGILQIEELSSVYEDDGINGFFKSLISRVTDGIDPDKVFEMGILRFIMDGYSGIDALICLMYLKGILMMQEGVFYHEVSLFMKSMLPESVRKEIYEIEQRDKLSPEEECRQRIKELISKDANFNSDQHPSLEQLSSVITQMSDDDIKFVFDNYRISFRDWVLVMKLLPGIARKRIFDNLDIRRSDELIYSMDCMGPIRLSDAENTAVRILKSFEWLMEIQEISKVEF